MDDALEKLAAVLRGEMAAEPDGPGKIALQEIHDRLLVEARHRRETPRLFDYRELLKRYMAHVGNRAGHTYLSDVQIEVAIGLKLLDKGEAEELRAIARAIGKEGPRG